MHTTHMYLQNEIFFHYIPFGLCFAILVDGVLTYGLCLTVIAIVCGHTYIHIMCLNV